MTYKLDEIKILIIDDMIPMIDITKSVLSIFGIRNIFTANNGADGFELVCQEDPDLIITDWMMEPMDGMEFVKKVRCSSETSNPYVPCLLYTSPSPRDQRGSRMPSSA